VASRNLKVGSVVGAAVVVGVTLIRITSSSPTAEEAVAEADAARAEALSAARSVARDLDGTDRSLMFDDVEQALGRVSSDRELVVRLPDDWGRDSEGLDDGPGYVTTDRYQITDNTGKHAACLTIESTFEDFGYDVAASAAPGGC
jgi:hypothetical protein